MRKWLLCSLALACLCSGLASAGTIRVSAAISLKDALTDIARAYQSDGGDEVVLAFASSGQLATQIRNGADVDVFISAADKQVDELAKDGVVRATTRVVVAQNSLVLIVPAGDALAPASFESLADTSVKKLAIGEPKTVPAGDYAMQVLTALKVADKLGGRVVYGTNARQVLAYVEKGQVSAGIVYATDAMESGGKVKVVATAGPDTHKPIVYPAVVISASKHADSAGRFLAYLQSDKAKATLADKGFITGGAGGAGAGGAAAATSVKGK